MAPDVKHVIPAEHVLTGLVYEFGKQANLPKVSSPNFAVGWAYHIPTTSNESNLSFSTTLLSNQWAFLQPSTWVRRSHLRHDFAMFFMIQDTMR
ncbi:hypothetical protein AC578_8187 [Pseudocercospora eumusae]|uniref:Uncharacterized protein n=1 Tax=Pseudocercospora eumusae TaxID=321146 RepID=A0A139HEU7_9PEZI|nr:hypothetical protein AC578_8187 [Pseudocercospora eumusae]